MHNHPISMSFFAITPRDGSDPSRRLLSSKEQEHELRLLLSYSIPDRELTLPLGWRHGGGSR